LVKWVAHVMLGLGASLLILNPSLEHAWYVGVSSAIGSLLPDLDLKVKHRRLFHNFWGLLIILLSLYAIFLKVGIKIPIVYFTSFSIGFILHIITDGFTFMGVYPFWPFKFRFRVTKFKYDDAILNFILVIIGFILIGMWLYDVTRFLRVIS